jgi:hypothetical protein
VVGAHRGQPSRLAPPGIVNETFAPFSFDLALFDLALDATSHGLSMQVVGGRVIAAGLCLAKWLLHCVNSRGVQNY